ncbi:MAG TPA: hypothetical protein PLI17_05260 [Denitromonas sp.]|nr:hypothetical protein [Denitromonas sp.]
MTEPNPPSLYARLGDTGIAHLVDRLYERMATLPEVRQVWQMYHEDLTQTKARLRVSLRLAGRPRSLHAPVRHAAHAPAAPGVFHWPQRA